MQWALSAFQTVGAALGFLATFITIWAYFTKERPTATVVGAALGGFGQRSSYLRVRNRSDRPILLHLEGGRHTTEMTVWPDHDTKSAIYAVMPGTKTTITVEPQSELLLPLVPPSSYDEVDDDSEMVARVHRSYAQPLLWRPQRPLRVSIQKRSYRAVVAGTLREAGGDV